MTEESKKSVEDTVQRPEADSRPLVHPGVDNRQNGKVLLGYTRTMWSIDDVKCSRVLNCNQTARFREHETDNKYWPLDLFLCSFLIWGFHRVTVSRQGNQCYFTRFDLGLRHSSDSKWEQYFGGNGSFLGKGFAAQRSTTSAVMFWSARLKFFEQGLHGTERFCKTFARIRKDTAHLESAGLIRFIKFKVPGMTPTLLASWERCIEEWVGTPLAEPHL